MASEPAGLSWPVVQRLQGLIRIESKLLQNDKYNKLAIVQAIMQTYRSGKLDWNPGLVTYWASTKGQLCQPRPLDWAEFREVQELHPDETSFWIEGVRHSKPRYIWEVYLFGDIVTRSEAVAFTRQLQRAAGRVFNVYGMSSEKTGFESTSSRILTHSFLTSI